MMNISYIFILLALVFSLNGQDINLSLYQEINNSQNSFTSTNVNSHSLVIERELNIHPIENFKFFPDTMSPLILKYLQRTYVESNLCIGIGGNEKISLSGIGLEVSVLRRFKENSNHYFTFSGGYERLSSYIPSYTIPLTVGYQFSEGKDAKFEPFFYGKIGYGSAFLSDDLKTTWETRSVDGGIRYEIGIGLLRKLTQNIGWTLKASFINQKMDYYIDSEWNKTHTAQVLNRVFIKLGVLF